MKSLPWIAFISQTGSEVVDISESLGITPKYILSNNKNKISDRTHKFIYDNRITLIISPFHVEEKNYNFIKFLPIDLITLNGFLKILPGEFCEENQGKIFNGHPGLITRYPELKGKDPQLRAYKGNYPYVGSVIHKVTPIVDDGEVIVVEEVKRKGGETLDEIYNILRSTSLESWKKFFKLRYA